MNLKEKLTEALNATGAIQTDDWYVSLNKQDIETLLKAIEERWIPVTERLPEEDAGTFIFCTADGYVSQGFRSAIGWHETYVGNTFKDVTHWMPLPTPPKG